ncbi:hypothetical protein D3C86_1791470 [compost metagenome]
MIGSFWPEPSASCGRFATQLDGLGQQREFTGSESVSVLLMPFLRSSGLKLEPDQNTMRFGSVPVRMEQW